MILFSDVYFIKIKQNQIKQIYQIQNLINLQKEKVKKFQFYKFNKKVKFNNNFLNLLNY